MSKARELSKLPNYALSTVAELKLAVGKEQGDKAFIGGYYADADGGGGDFYWDAVSVEADNGGTIFQVTGTTTGRWKRIYSSSISVKWFGAKDDDDGSLTTTNSLTAFANCFAYLNSIGGGVMHLPKTATGGYFINGDDTTPSSGNIEIVADEGVYLRIIYSGGITNSPFANNNLKYNRELLKIMHNYGFKAYGYKDVNPRPSENLNTLTQGQGVYSVPRVLGGTDFKVIDFGDTNTVVTPIVSTSESIAFDADAVVIGATKFACIGEEVFGLLSSPTGGEFLVGVLTTNGYSYYSQNSGTQAVTLIENDTGHSPIANGVPYSFLDQQRDNFNNALLSVKVLSSHSYQVLVNGLVVGSHTTHSSIISVAFGATNINDTVTLSQMSSVYGNSKGGSKPLRIISCGDSISDNNVQYSPYRVMNSVLQSAGIQLSHLNNIATSGETSSQQLAKLITIGSGYDYCLIQVGVNDIQGGVAFATFTQNIIDMVTYAKSMGMTAIVGIPTSFYSLAEANANGQTGGQNTSNNASGHTYRALLIRAVASAGGYVNLQSQKNYGAITAKWLSLNEVGLHTDSILTDNIHPTPYGAKQLGLGWAESILGALHKADLTFMGYADYVPSSWMKNGFGVTSKPKIKGTVITGSVYFDGATNADGNPFMTLPPSLRLHTTTMFTVVAVSIGGLPLGATTIYIGTDGNCYAFILPVGTKSIELGTINLLDYLIK
jgi:lysophospholipase L1-like esterase